MSRAISIGRSPTRWSGTRNGPTYPCDPETLSPDEATWEATRLNIVLANKGYSDSDVTRWWNFTRHAELDDQTIAEAWKAGEYTAVSHLIESLPDKHGSASPVYFDE